MPSLWTTLKLAGHLVAVTVLFVAAFGMDGMSNVGDLKPPRTRKPNPVDSGVPLGDPALNPSAAISQFRSLIDSINEPSTSQSRSQSSTSFGPLAEASQQSDRLQEMFAAFRVAAEQAAGERGISLRNLSSWPLPSDAETN